MLRVGAYYEQNIEHGDDPRFGQSPAKIYLLLSSVDSSPFARLLFTNIEHCSVETELEPPLLVPWNNVRAF